MKSKDPLTIKNCLLENFGKRPPTLLTITAGYVPEFSGSMNLEKHKHDELDLIVLPVIINKTGSCYGIHAF